MRKLIWCAAAGAVAAGSAWATVYAWNHQDATARGTVASTCMVSLVNKVHEAKPKAETAKTPTHETAKATNPAGWNNPRTLPPVPEAHETKLAMPIVIREETETPAAPTADEAREALAVMNHGYDGERLAILEQLRPLIKEIAEAEIQVGSPKVTEDSVCPQPMPYCTDEEKEVSVAEPAPVMPYADDEPVSQAVILSAGEIIWAVPFLGAGDTPVKPAEMLKLVEEIPAELDLAIRKALEDNLPKVEDNDSPSWLSWGQRVDATMGDGTEEAEPKTPEEESYHYHDHDLSCPYSGCPYPGDYRRMPEPPAEESEPKKPEEKPKEPVKVLHLDPVIVVGAGGITVAAQVPTQTYDLNSIGTRMDGSNPNNALQNLSGDRFNNYSAELKATFPLRSLNSGVDLQEPVRTHQVKDAVLSFAESVALAVAQSKVFDCSDMSLSSLVNRAKEMLADYVHMATYDREAYCEDPVFMPMEKVETSEPAKATSDTLEFRPSDRGSYEVEESGPY